MFDVRWKNWAPLYIHTLYILVLEVSVLMLLPVLGRDGNRVKARHSSIQTSTNHNVDWQRNSSCTRMFCTCNQVTK